jgi:1,4-alpha-glucan branching enzyme
MSVVEELTARAHPRDADQRQVRAARCTPDQPIAIYQVHLASWMRVPEEQNRPLTLSELASKLAAHLENLGFTHVQLHLPSYADQPGLKNLADCLHQRNLGLILETNLGSKNAVPPNSGGFLGDGVCADGDTLLFDYRYTWDAAWSEETCSYFSLDPSQRKSCQAPYVRRESHAFTANYILPLSDALVTRPRRSLWTAMPGDAWQKFANLRLLFACQYLLPGKKLVFMGNEIGQQNPWRPETSLDWHLIQAGGVHGQLMNWVANLNRFYRAECALFQTDASAAGFQWVYTSDASSGVISFLRRNADGREVLLAVLNFAPAPLHNYRVGVPQGGFWEETLNSDAREFGGSGQGNLGGMEAAPFGWNSQSHSLIITLPPLGAVVFKAPQNV